MHVIAALWAGLVVWFCTEPVNDLDSYWHVLIGREILHRHTLDGLGTEWLGVPAPPWRTSQWLAETGMAQIVQLWGWHGLVAIRAILAAVTLAVVARTLLPGRPAAICVPAFAATSYSLISIVQDRPQTVSVLAVACLALISAQLLTGHPTGRRLPWQAVAAGCLVWAQLHPLWILAPAAFTLLALTSLLDGAVAGRHRLRPALLYAVASLAGVLNPQGLTSFLLPLRFHAATGLIREWQPTNVLADFTAIWALVILGTVLAWARSPGPVSRGELVWTLAWWVFGALAVRNVVPSLLLTAPVAVTAGTRAWGSTLARTMPPSGPREGRVLLVACALATLPGLLLSGFDLARLDPLRDTPARAIAGYLARQPAPQRVFNAYETSGVLAAFGGGKVRLVQDGRTDLWGGPYLRRINEAQSLRGPWHEVLDSFRPDVCVLATESGLTTLLRHGGGWHVVMTEGPYVLLARSHQPQPSPGSVLPGGTTKPP